MHHLRDSAFLIDYSNSIHHCKTILVMNEPDNVNGEERRGLEEMKDFSFLTFWGVGGEETLKYCSVIAPQV